jgi:hypothetical protein
VVRQDARDVQGGPGKFFVQLSRRPDRRGVARDRWALETAGGAWDYSVDVDPSKQLEERAYQRVYCSHYASEPRGSWDYRPVQELQDFYRELSSIISRENGKG